MTSMFANPGTGNPEGTKGDHKAIRCPKCGERFGQLPQHLVACDGGDSV